MSGILFYIAAGACIAVLIVLVFGIGTFARGKSSARASNKIMQLRVILQAVALALIMAVVYFAKQGN